MSDEQIKIIMANQVALEKRVRRLEYWHAFTVGGIAVLTWVLKYA